MESLPQNPEFRINPENFHPCIRPRMAYFDILQGLSYQFHFGSQPIIWK